MLFTVNKLAKLSGVSSRTLRFYDKIGILEPAYYGENHYRYYEEEQLLMLQQILFFRELGFSLSDIKRIINYDDFDKIKALKSHKNILKQDLERTNSLIKTIDKTIAHLRGKKEMKAEEIYYGFDSEIQKKHEKYLIDKGILTQEFIDECNRKIKNWSDKEKNDFLHEGEKIMEAIIIAIEKPLTPTSEEVQTLMRKHYHWIERSWTPTKKSYIDLAQLYQTNEFRDFFDRRHPKLLDFMVASMKVFAENVLE